MAKLLEEEGTDVNARNKVRTMDPDGGEVGRRPRKGGVEGNGYACCQ